VGTESMERTRRGISLIHQLIEEMAMETGSVVAEAAVSA
jgi:hypothetical protein